MTNTAKVQGKVVPFPNKESYELTTPDLHRALGQLEGTAKMVQEGLSQVTKSQAETNLTMARIDTKIDTMAVSQAGTHQLALDALAAAQKANSRIDTFTAKAIGAGIVGSASLMVLWFLLKPAIMALLNIPH